MKKDRGCQLRKVFTWQHFPCRGSFRRGAKSSHGNWIAWRLNFSCKSIFFSLFAYFEYTYFIKYNSFIFYIYCVTKNTNFTSENSSPIKIIFYRSNSPES